MSNGLPHEPLIRVAALHALAYCERLYYLEEVEEIRVANAKVYAGRALHAAAEEETESFELESDSLGIRGKLDAVKHRDGSWTVIEDKRGRAQKESSGVYSAWPSDRLQVIAYSLLLEEHLGIRLPEGRVRYHADNVTVRIPLDETARQSVFNAIQRAKELRKSLQRPPVTNNEKLCVHCSLAPVCLPEEERILDNEDETDIIQLFPEMIDTKTIHITSQRSSISKHGSQLRISTPGEDSKNIPSADIHAIVLHGYPQVSTQALHYCAYKRIAVHWFTGGGKYVGCLSPGPSPVHRRIRQYQALINEQFRLLLSRKVASAKVESQLRYTLRATRKNKPRPPHIKKSLQQIRDALKTISSASSIDSVRGAEGWAAKAYFAVLPQLLNLDSVPDMHPAGRSRRPPKDRFNALLSFGYALLQNRVLQAILVVGLEPAFGFYHAPRSAAHPLALDLMELFRVILWDIPLIGSINRKQWNPQEDFSITKTKVWLSRLGRKKAITLFEQRLQEKWKHPILEYSLDYARTIELEARLLEKEWTGQAGLFAKARIR